MSSLQEAIHIPWFTYALIWTTELVRKQISYSIGPCAFSFACQSFDSQLYFQTLGTTAFFMEGRKSFHVFWNCWGNVPRILNSRAFSTFLWETLAVRDWESRKVLRVESRGWNRMCLQKSPSPNFSEEREAQRGEVICQGCLVRWQQHLE